MSDVVAGKSSAAPIGTSGITAASPHRERGMGYRIRPITNSTVPIRIAAASPTRSTMGPSSTLRITNERMPT